MEEGREKRTGWKFELFEFDFVMEFDDGEELPRQPSQGFVHLKEKAHVAR